jgi:hypothetical protein
MFAGILISVVLSQSAPSLAQGRAHVEAFRAGRVERLSPAMRFDSPGAVLKFAAGYRSYGDESKIVSEGLAEKNGLFVYTRVAAVSNWARGLELEVTMDPQGRLVHATMGFPNKEAPTTYGAYRPLVKLRLPLEETWHVLWGGRTWEDNRHAAVSDMRFALDLLQRKNGSSAQGKGTRNEDYFAWNQWVIAPADGVIAVAKDGVVDNAPNRAVGGNLYGNLLVIDHGTEEFSLLGHLKQGSLIVKVGERVTKGQRIARVGNSGMSTEPHLHFQLMDTADWRSAHGLPLVIHDAVRNGTLVDRFEPRRGDVITPLAQEARRD